MSITPAKYIEVLKKHGRRVANRVALASMPVVGRTLYDYYACYAPEEDLPEKEQCVTGMSAMFDPDGWFIYYDSSPRYDLWPEAPPQEQT